MATVAQPRRRARKSLANFLGGATSGMISTLLLQPFDVIKTRMQMSSAFNRSVHLKSALSIQSNIGVWHTMRSIVRQDTIAGLWRGVVPTFVRNSLGVGLYFVTLSSLSSFAARIESSPDGSLSNRSALLAGALSRSFAVLVLCPLTVAKCRLETVEYSRLYRGSMFGALGSIGRNEGIRGLFSGLVPAIARDAPYSAVYMLLYLRTKAYVGNLAGIDSSSKITNTSRTTTYVAGTGTPDMDKDNAKLKLMAVNFTCGGISGALATLLTQPQDVIKTRMQLTQLHLGGGKKYGTVREATRRIFNEEGLYGFFRGSSARVLKRMFGSAVTWMVFEEMVTRYHEMLKSQGLQDENEVSGAMEKAR